MGGRERGKLVVTSGLLALLLLSLIGPQVAASGGSGTIESSSISLMPSHQTDTPFLNFSFDVVEQSGQSADVTAQTTLKTIGGSILESINESKTIPMNGVETFSVNFSTLPFGYSIVETILTGDVGANSSTHTIGFNRTVQRLVPLDIGFASSGDITFTSLGTNGQETGNLSISDGDLVGVGVPVLNNGDYPWTGTITANFSSGSSQEFLSINEVEVPPMASVILFINSTIAMSEGQASIVLELNASGDGDATDELRTVLFQVGPPPLPQMDLHAELLTVEYAAGDVLDWNLTVANNGAHLFTGTVICNFGQTTVLNESLEVNVLASTILPFTTQARPAELNCDVSGMRISDASLTPFTSTFDVISAVFEAAGSSSPGVLDGPWHVGDSARFSMLVRNHGDVAGSVAIECTTSQSVYTSSELFLAVDAAGEVSVVVPMLLDGDQLIEWRLISPDGSIDEGLNGSVVVPVAAKQFLIPTVQNVTWDAETGVTMSWSVELADGVDRPVRIRLGYFDSGETYLMDYMVDLTPGIMSGSFNLGFIEADRVTLRVDAFNWSEAVGPSSDSRNVPSSRPVYSLQFDPLAAPPRPTMDQSATVKVTVVNTGEVAGQAGELLLLGEDNTLFDTQSTPALDAGESMIMTLTLQSWPDGTRVGLKAVWTVGEEQLTGSETFLSAEVEQASEGFAVPWLGLLGGLALAGALIAAVRIKQAQSLNPSSKVGKPSKRTSSSKSKASVSDVKIQIGCPECARQLRVPASYTGSVRCPDCSNKFDVEGKQEESEAPEEVEEEEEEIEVVEEKVEISCPECSQSLRVPHDYAGSVRCPSCEHVFKAKG